jgi:hypothetical protein
MISRLLIKQQEYTFLNICLQVYKLQPLKKSKILYKTYQLRYNELLFYFKFVILCLFIYLRERRKSLIYHMVDVDKKELSSHFLLLQNLKYFLLYLDDVTSLLIELILLVHFMYEF